MEERISLCLVRHGRTAGNVRRGYIGSRTDEDLCQQGREELARFAEEGRYPDVDIVFASPMKRCLQTAALIWPGPLSREKARLIPDLRECDFGEFEGKSYAELSGVPTYQEWLASEGMGPFPGGEDPKAFMERTCAAFEKTVGQAFAEDVPLAGYAVHGGTIMSVMERFASEKKGYYEWHVMNGEGFLVTVDRNVWERCRRFSGERRLL